MKHKTKRLLSIVLALGLVFSLGSAAFADVEQPKGSFTALQELIDSAGSSGTVTLDRDYIAAEGEDVLHIRKNTEITLDLNGYRIDRVLGECDPVENGGILMVEAAEYTSGENYSDPDIITTPGGVLTVTDTSTLHTGALCGGNTTGSGGAVLVDEYASLTMEDVLVSGCSAAGNGGAVCLENGASCIMNDCTIVLCSAGCYGGGVYAGNMTTFTMEGSEISLNDASNGGGISLLSGEFEFSDSLISNNAAVEYGGGIDNECGFALCDSWVYGNTAGEQGAGVYNGLFTEMCVSGETVVVDNLLDGGEESNVYTFEDIVAEEPYNCSSYITIDDEGLTDGAWIGITAELFDGSGYTRPTEARAAAFCLNGTAEDVSYFIPDLDCERVVYNTERGVLELQHYGGPVFDLCNGEPLLYMDELTAENVQWNDYTFTGFYTARTGGEKVTFDHEDGVTYYAHWESDWRPVLTEMLSIDETDALLLGNAPADEALLEEYGITYDAAAHALTLENTVIHCADAEKSIFAKGSPLTLKVYGEAEVKNDFDTVICAVNGLTIEPAYSNQAAGLDLTCRDDGAAIWAPHGLTIRGAGLDMMVQGCIDVFGDDFCLQDATLAVSGTEPIYCSLAFSMQGGFLMATTYDSTFPALHAEAFDVDLTNASTTGIYLDDILHFDAEEEALVHEDGTVASFVVISFTSFDLQNGSPLLYERPETPEWGDYDFDGWYNLPWAEEKVHDGENFVAPYTAFEPGSRYYAGWTQDGKRIVSGQIHLAGSDLTVDCSDLGNAQLGDDNTYSILCYDGTELCFSASAHEIVSDLLTEAEAMAAADGAAPEDVSYRRFNGIPAAEYRMGNSRVFLAPDGNGKLVRVVFPNVYDEEGETTGSFFALYLMYSLRADTFEDDINIFLLVREMTILQAQRLAEGYTEDPEVARILETLDNWTTEYDWWDSSLEKDEAPFEILISELYHRLETLAGHQLVAHAAFWLSGRESDYTGGRPFSFCTACLTDMSGNMIDEQENYYGVFTYDDLAPGYYNLVISAYADDLGTDEDYYRIVSKLIFIDGTNPLSVEFNMSDHTPSSYIEADSGILVGNLDTLQPTAYAQIRCLPGPTLSGYVDGGFELSVTEAGGQAEGAEEIFAAAGSRSFAVYDASLCWTASDIYGEEQETVVLHDTSVPAVGRDNALAIVIPMQTAGRTLCAYRWHDGRVQQLRQISALPTGNASDGTFYVGNGYVILYASRFSTYAIGDTPVYERPEKTATVPPKYNTCPKNDSCPLSSFSDLTPDAWYHDGIHFCLDRGLMNGMTADIFASGNTTTRGQLVTILYRLEGEPAFMNANIFRDVPEGSYYEKAIVWANGKGIVKGYGDDCFGPDDPITREQLAAILYRYAQYKEADVSVDENTNFLSFNDFGDIREYAKPSMMWAIENGLIQGDGQNLMPQGSASRAQAAAILQRYCELFAK